MKGNAHAICHIQRGLLVFQVVLFSWKNVLKWLASPFYHPDTYANALSKIPHVLHVQNTQALCHLFLNPLQ